MAYISQEEKKELMPAIKAVLQKYKLKASVSINHYSTLVVTIKSGPIDFISNYIVNGDLSVERALAVVKQQYMDVNRHSADNTFDGKAKDCINELIVAMKGNKWYDKTDSMVDHFNIAYYLNINVGKWNKPYIVQTV